jgi:hypothetical protein
MESKALTELATTYQMEEKDFVSAVKAQCFKDGAASDTQLMMLLSFARQYSLNPLAKECYAFIGGGKVNIGVQSDGWSTIANRDPDYDGQEIEYEYGGDGKPVAIISRTYVKGRAHPTVYRAAMDEWQRETDIWKKMPSHQLYLKARNQGIRFALGVSAYDPDDIQRIEEAQAVTVKAEVVKEVTQVFPDAKMIEREESVRSGLARAELEATDIWKNPKTRGRRKVDAEVVKGAEVVVVENGGGGTVGDTPPPSAPAAAVVMKLENDLVAFIVEHDIQKKRVDLALAKYGAASIAELKPDEQMAILIVFQKSYQGAI